MNGWSVISILVKSKLKTSLNDRLVLLNCIAGLLSLRSKCSFDHRSFASICHFFPGYLRRSAWCSRASKEWAFRRDSLFGSESTCGFELSQLLLVLLNKALLGLLFWCLSNLKVLRYSQAFVCHELPVQHGIHVNTFSFCSWSLIGNIQRIFTLPFLLVRLSDISFTQRGEGKLEVKEIVRSHGR